MFDLESAIRFHTEEAEIMKQHKSVNELILGNESYEKELQEHRQLAAWLRELQERRKQPEIIRCKDCIKGKYHNLAKSTMCMLHPFYPVRIEPDGFCKWAERKTECQTGLKE